MLGLLPGYHIYGLVKTFLFPISQGGSTVLMKNWDPQLFKKAIEEFRTTICAAVPPILVFLAHDPSVDELDFSVRKIFLLMTGSLTHKFRA